MVTGTSRERGTSRKVTRLSATAACPGSARGSEASAGTAGCRAPGRRRHARTAAGAPELGRVEGVLNAEDVTGPYDVSGRAEAPAMDDLGQLVVAKVQAVDGITRTLTCPVVHL